MKRYLLPLSYLLLVGLGLFGMKTTYDRGLSEGLDKYHAMCYHVGGIVVHENGTVVQCQRLSDIPKKELDKFNKTV